MINAAQASESQKKEISKLVDQLIAFELQNIEHHSSDETAVQALYQVKNSGRNTTVLSKP